MTSECNEETFPISLCVFTSQNFNMLLSLIQKSKSIMGIGENTALASPPSSSTVPSLPNDLQRYSDKSPGSMEGHSTIQSEHKEFQELIYGTHASR